MVYVDKITEYPPEIMDAQTRRCGTKWSHLWCDPGKEEELHALARQIGMSRSWFQPKKGFSHYDLVPSRRTRAIAAGAVETDLMDWLRERRRLQSA